MGSPLEGILQSIPLIEGKTWRQKSEASGHIAPRAEKQKDSRVGSGQGINPHSGSSPWWLSVEDILHSNLTLSMKADRKKKVEKSLEFGYQLLASSAALLLRNLTP